jgi:hypothetical protein
MKVDAGVRPFSSGKLRAIAAKIDATMTWPAILAQPPRPRLRWLRVFMRSSMKPTPPRPTIRNSTSRPPRVSGTSTHGGCSPLGVVGLGSIITDELAPLQPLEQLDEDRGHKQGEGQRNAAGNE